MKAAIDVGSNSLLLTVVDDDGGVMHDEARVVGLGKGLGDRGLFQQDRMAAAVAVLQDYAARARELGVAPPDVMAVATSAARRALNADTFFAHVAQQTGLRIRVISGEEEARLTWIGAQRDLPLGDGVRLVVDLGGGSTELVLGTPKVIHTRRSLEIGTVRLTEAHLVTKKGVPDRYDPQAVSELERAVDLALDGAELEAPPEHVVAVAGTATTLAAMALGLARYDAAAVHGSSLDRSALARFVDTLRRADAAERRRLAAVSPERADYLLAGAIVLGRVLALARRSAMTVSDRGLRFGLL